MGRLAGTGGNVLVASVLIEDCEDVFNEQVDADVTASADTTDYKVGSASAKFVCAALLANGDIIASEVVSVDASACSQIMFWAKCSVGIAAGDLALLLSETASLGGTPVVFSIPALSAGVWKLCKVTGDLSALNAIISVGPKLIANDPGSFNFWLDEIRAAKQVAGIKGWTLDQVVEALETTGFDSSGNRTYSIGLKGWSGSFEGNKDGAPLTIGSVVHLELQESSTATQHWRGSAIITGLHVNTSVDGLVTYSYDFQGTDAIELVTA